LAGSKPAKSTPDCAASHWTAASETERETISTSAAGNLLGGLRRIAAIGKEARSAARDGQRGAGACESGEIAEVGKTGDQQAVKPGFGQADDESGFEAQKLRRCDSDWLFQHDMVAKLICPGRDSFPAFRSHSIENLDIAGKRLILVHEDRIFLVHQFHLWLLFCVSWLYPCP
jgi:hypothetical protein